MAKLNYKFNFNKVGYVFLTKGEIAYFDLEDYEKIMVNRWSCEKMGENFYAHKKDKSKTVRMHNVIMPAKEGFIIDHKNENTLDNRKCNLRYVNKCVNALNKRSYKGWEKSCSGKYYARIRLKSMSKDYRLGPFETGKEAKKAYEEKKKEIIKSILG